MQLVHKNVRRDADGRIVGTTEFVIEHDDITRRAVKVAHRNANVAAREAVAFDRLGKLDLRDEALDVAHDWAVVELVACGKHPGAITIDEAGNVTGCTVHQRPEGLTLRFDR